MKILKQTYLSDVNLAEWIFTGRRKDQAGIPHGIKNIFLAGTKIE
jgi:hypothetical protein